jgi:uncharacterized protein
VTRPPAGSLVANAVAFGRLLRRAGLAVEPGQTRLFLDALAAVGVSSPALARFAGHAVFVRRREDLPVFDQAFSLFWRRHGLSGADSPVLPRIRQSEPRRPTFPSPVERLEGPALEADLPRKLALASRRELLRHADFATLTPTESDEALALLSAWRPALPHRRSRRWKPARGGSRPALRAMLRASVRTGGEVLAWKWLRRRSRPRPVVLVTDVSGSMERYSRLLLRFAHVLAHTGAPLEVFAFGTRLTRITRDLRVRDPDDALRRVGRAVVDWNGGTRIGESLHTLNRQWVRRAVRSGAIVLLASDGWERGDPALLEAEMATLRRSCYRLLWLDPLAERPGFAPETAGLRAALPHVDALLPCASVASLMSVAKELDRT